MRGRQRRASRWSPVRPKSLAAPGRPRAADIPSQPVMSQRIRRLSTACYRGNIPAGISVYPFHPTCSNGAMSGSRRRRRRVFLLLHADDSSVQFEADGARRAPSSGTNTGRHLRYIQPIGTVPVGRRIGLFRARWGAGRPDGSSRGLPTARLRPSSMSKQPGTRHGWELVGISRVSPATTHTRKRACALAVRLLPAIRHVAGDMPSRRQQRASFIWPTRHKCVTPPLYKKKRDVISYCAAVLWNGMTGRDAF